jgi:hypothetical protein
MAASAVAVVAPDVGATCIANSNARGLPGRGAARNL